MCVGGLNCVCVDRYHLLLGATTLIMLDNGCGEHSKISTELAIAPYVAHGIDVRHDTRLRCLEIMEDTMPRSNATRNAGTQSAGDVVVWLDDDELLVLPDDLNLTSVGHRMRELNVCAVRLLWRVFGNGGHLCQPYGGHLARDFVLRSNASESWNAKGGLLAQGKMAFLNPGGGEYPCGSSGRGLHECKCSPFKCDSIGRPAARCAEFQPAEMWIAHYAFQSVAHWEEKKARGGIQRPSIGSSPMAANAHYDGRVLRSLARRVVSRHQSLSRDDATSPSRNR